MSRHFLPSGRFLFHPVLGNVEYTTLFQAQIGEACSEGLFPILHRLLPNFMKTRRRLPRISAHLLLHCDLDLFLFYLRRLNQRRG